MILTYYNKIAQYITLV